MAMVRSPRDAPVFRDVLRLMDEQAVLAELGCGPVAAAPAREPVRAPAAAAPALPAGPG